MGACEVYFNPSCSKCRAARALLEEHGLEARYIHYLDTPPTRAELEALLAKLGTDDPRAIMRGADAAATRDQLLDALVADPSLLERPIVVLGDRAVVARPPERLLELFPGARR